MIFQCQNTQVNWHDALEADPYSSEPVDNEHDLIGRDFELSALKPKKKSKNVASYVIFGQKRVGKTSIAKTLQSNLQSRDDVQPIFLEVGSVRHNTPQQTIDKIVMKIATEVKKTSASLNAVSLPECDGSLSPLDNYLSEIKSILPETKFIIMIDEFDELPQEMFRKGDIADSFFLTIRSISHMKNFGFILIGGEKMEYLLNHYGEKLNKFDPMRVDYFDRKDKWGDFKALVKHPVDKILEISDEAVVALYDASAGNPFFTKLICRYMFEIMLKKRESHVSLNDMRESISHTISNIDGKSFAHFWEDGIIERGDYHVQVSLNRKRIFSSVGHLLSIDKPVTLQNIEEYYSRNHWEKSWLRQEVDALVRREILKPEQLEELTYSIQVGLFRDWLKEYGIRYLATTLNDKDYEEDILRRQADLAISSEEIAKWCKKIGTYKAHELTTDIVRVWLGQFGDIVNQRLAFNLLQELKFYSQNEVRRKMKDAFQIVLRGMKINAATKKRSEFVVSQIGKVGKSSMYYSRLFADENQIYVDNVVAQDKIEDFILSNPAVKSIVFIDDIAGTGGTAIDGIDQLYSKAGSTIRDRKIVVHFITICTTKKAQRRIEEHIEKLDIDIRFFSCDLIEEREVISSSEFKPTYIKDSNSTKRLIEEFGVRIKRGYEMGYGGEGLLVVFETNCPNNIPAILWCETPQWKALFPR